MDKKTKIMYVISFIVLFAFLIYNISKGSQWMYDSLISIAFVFFIFSIRNKFKLTFGEVLAGLICVFLHNLGTFDAYGLQFYFEFDTFIHFISTVVAGVVAVRYFKREKFFKKGNVNLFFLIIGVIVLFSVGIEIMEYGGYLFFGEGDGLLFTGSGDAGKWNDGAGQYIDTMNDLIVNLTGAIVGFFIAQSSRIQRS